MARFDTPAIYVRQSTEDQSSEHQLDDIREWLDQHDLTIGDVEVYSEQASGASADRDEFSDLIESIALQHLDMHTAFPVWDPPADLFDVSSLPGVPRHGLGRGFKVGARVYRGHGAEARNAAAKAEAERLRQ